MRDMARPALVARGVADVGQVAAYGAVNVVVHALGGVPRLERVEYEPGRVHAAFEGGVHPVRGRLRQSCARLDTIGSDEPVD